MSEDTLTEEEKDRLRRVLWELYITSFVDVAYDVSNEYGLEAYLKAATDEAKVLVERRVTLVEKAVRDYIKTIDKKAKALRREGASRETVLAELEREARSLAEVKGQLIAEVEEATARMDGANAVVLQSGKPFKWHFPHFDLRGDEECPICEAIREGAPYTTEEARAEGYPGVPHPNCDHGWVLVPA